MPEVSSDFTTFTVRIRPGIYFQDHPAFKGQKRELVAQDYVYSIKRFYNPKFKSQNVTLLENSKLLGLSEIRAAALKGAKFDYDREVEGVRALDRYTLRIKLGEPAPRFHHYLANSCVPRRSGARSGRDVRREADDGQSRRHRAVSAR